MAGDVLTASARPSTRETTVDILVQTAGTLEELTPEQWTRPSLCEDWRVIDVASHLIWRVGTPGSRMVRALGRSLIRTVGNPKEAMERLSLAWSFADTADIVARIRHTAAAKLAGEGRAGTGEMTECLVHAYDMANPLGIRIAADPEVTEKVARNGLLLASPRVRAVLRERTLHAVDAGWHLGRGPVIEGTAEAIVLYVFGRRPQRARGH